MAQGFMAPPQQEEAAQQDGEPWRHAFRSLKRFVAAPMQQQDGESLETPLASDMEAGVQEAHTQMARWTRSAFGRVRNHAAQAAEQAQQGIQQGVERAQTVDWQEKVQGVRGNLSRSFEGVAHVTTSASSAVQDRVVQGAERVRSVEWGEQVQGLQRGVSTGFENIASGAQAASSNVRESAGVAAGASRQALHVAGERVQGAAQLAMDPQKLMRFGGVFFLGILLVVISFNFLPALLLKPGNFAVFFTAGSMTIMSSFILLHGYQGFYEGMIQKQRLPFSVTYAVGLVGTLWATLIQRSFIFTAVFAIMQACALLYLTCSYVPGGTAFLNMVGRFGGRSVRSVALG